MTAQSTDRSIGQLVADSVDDVRTIIRHEKALAKAEISRAAKTGGVGAGLLGAAAGALGLAVVFLLVAAAEALAEAGMTRWGAYLLVGGVLLLLGLLLAAVGALTLKRLKGPERTIKQGKGTVADVKGALSGDGSAVPATVPPSRVGGATAVTVPRGTGAGGATAVTVPRGAADRG